MFRGRWKVKELKVRWFCRNCLQKGIAGITVLPAMHFDGLEPAKNIVQTIQTTCHTNCKKPDIRIHYDSKTQIGI